MNSAKTHNITTRISLYELYQILFNYYGSCHWWPGETPFEVIIGAILTQNTAWKNVETAIKNLKDRNILTPERLEKVPLEELALLIRSSGYYNQKARKIKSLLEYYKLNYNYKLDNISKVSLDVLREELLSVFGIGEETADSILLYALNKPTFVIDAYTKRILNRMGFFSYNTVSYRVLKQFCEKSLPYDTALFNEFHALFVKFGKTICQKKPHCFRCPVNDRCRYYISSSKK